ncbi:MAG TPA: hypothetical protein VGI81_04885 [Tepidisphaeraceae bacterium]|jgi:hypothetical protein
MDELMIHVERIVRPVRAFESRKLQMRRELLAHLQETLEDERRHHPGDEPAAIEEARRRLGDPGELTKQLQKTAPLLERLLMAKLPITRPAERAEVRAGRFLYGTNSRLTPWHASLLVLLAGPLAGLPCYTPQIVRDVLTHTGKPAHVMAFFVGVLVGLNVMILASYRLVFAAAEPGRLLWRPRVIGLAALVLGMQIAFQFFVAAAAADRLPTAGDLAASVTITVVLLVCSLLLSRGVARLRQPYEPWLSLEVAA